MARTYSINESFFETIDTPEKAYMLGWVVSDGYVGKENALVIRLQEKDKGILNVLRKLIGTNKPLILIDYKKYKKTNWSNQYSLSIYNKKICEDLRKLGYTNTKSKEAKFPVFNDLNLVRHFVRGLFEGDGCIQLKGKGKKNQLYITGTEEICKSLWHCMRAMELDAYIYPNTSVFKTFLGKTEHILKFLDWIYHDCQNMKLKRKYNSYLKLKRRVSCIY